MFVKYVHLRLYLFVLLTYLIFFLIIPHLLCTYLIILFLVTFSGFVVYILASNNIMRVKFSLDFSFLFAL